MEANQTSMVQAMQSVAQTTPVRKVESTELRPDSPASGQTSSTPALRVEPAVRVDISAEAKEVAANPNAMSNPAQSVERQIAVRKAEFTERAMVRAAEVEKTSVQSREVMSSQRMQDLAEKEKVQALVKADAPQPKKEVPVQQDNLYI
jgi:hypothetical protein